MRRERGSAAALDLGRDAPDTPPHPPPLLFNHIQKVVKKGSREGGLSWGRGVDKAEDSSASSLKIPSGYM